MSRCFLLRLQSNQFCSPVHFSSSSQATSGAVHSFTAQSFFSGPVTFKMHSTQLRTFFLPLLASWVAADFCPDVVTVAPTVAEFPIYISTFVAADTVINVNGNANITINNGPTNFITTLVGTSTIFDTVTTTTTETVTSTPTNGPV